MLQAEYFYEHLGSLTELYQDEFTYRRTLCAPGGPRAVTLSRIDRFYTNILASDLGDMRPTGSVLQSPMDLGNASDHVPLAFVLRRPGFEPVHSNRIPPWLARHEAFEEALKELNEHVNFQEDPVAALATAKLLAQDAAQLAKQVISNRVAQSSDEKLHWCMVLMRMSRTRVPRLDHKIFKCWPALGGGGQGRQGGQEEVAGHCTVPPGQGH